MPAVTTFCQFFGCTGLAVPSDYGDVPGKIIADYEGEWSYIDGVEYGSYAYGSSREFTAATPSLPVDGIAYYMANPSHHEIIQAAATYGYEPNDVTITIWAQTLMDGAVVIEPANGDFIILAGGDGTWRILSYRRVMDGAQWKCMCRKSVL